ncbi:ferredoxin [Ignisphaera aggregans DSM 17230]|uniref:Ferredoxin n=1 Tax=Ignisphaera aggregans (strain DSM 17230 / JCM 13409 / AQ1.S1) TaxID=583356 RepID=E0SRF8_IGNAA|nr:ferredoxin [Ignisphaera aggregans DSM 17230]
MVEIKPYNRYVESLSGRTFLDIARSIGIPIRAECGGIGICGKCKVIVEGRGELSPPTPNEIKILGDKGISQGYRLACQVKLLSGEFRVTIPPESVFQRYRSADIGYERSIPLEPAIRKIFISAPIPSLEDPKPDIDRILERIDSGLDNIEIPIDVIRKIPEVARVAKWNITIALWNNEKVIDVEPGDTSKRMYGIAIDIGTSKIVLHLVDLVSGETIAIESMPNPQISFGADIISRVTYALKDRENLVKLQNLVVQGINSLIDRVISRAGVQRENIYEAVVVGNTVMHHLFLGVEIRYLAIAPYVPISMRGLRLRARDIGLKINENGVVYTFPNIAGYVGGDAVADAIAVELNKCEEPCLLIDIGTNTEILLNTGREIYACSTPAGPAFEGATMRFGMRAASGAIDQVFIYFDNDSRDYIVRYNVIDNVKPIGICGSGYIDIVANLYRLDIIDRRGRFNRDIDSKRIVLDDEEGPRFIVAWSSETGIGRDIAVYGKDINELILAKAAIASGIEIILRRAGIDAEDLSKIFIAGSFGSYINIENAIAIGLIPKVDTNKIVFVGNTAISGAKLALKSIKIRREAEELTRKVKYIELSIDPLFRKIFTENLSLP